MSSESSGAGSASGAVGQSYDATVDVNTRWAADRTFWAADRTVIAWLRTAISLIGFGISIGKAGDVLEAQEIIRDPYHSLQIVGVAMIALAVLGLAGAVFQNLRIERRIASQGYRRIERTPLGLVMAILVLLVGIFSAFVIFL